MAKVNWLIYCQHAGSPNPGAPLTANGVLFSMSPKYIPGQFSFSIAASVRDLDITKPNSIRLTFHSNEDNAELIFDSNTLSIPPAPKEQSGVDLPKEYKGFILSMDCSNVDIKHSGVYVTDVYINGNRIYQASIYVAAQTSNGVGA